MALYCTADLVICVLLWCLKVESIIFIVWLFKCGHTFFCLQVGWDESAAGERQPRVSLWEIEPLTTFPMYPSLFPLRLKRPWHPGVSSVHGTCFLSN